MRAKISFLVACVSTHILYRVARMRLYGRRLLAGNPTSLAVICNSTTQRIALTCITDCSPMLYDFFGSRMLGCLLFLALPAGHGAETCNSLVLVYNIMTTISYRLPSFVFWLANCFSSSQYSSASSRPLICSIHVVEWRMETQVMGTSPIATCTLCTSCRRLNEVACEIIGL